MRRFVVDFTPVLDALESRHGIDRKDVDYVRLSEVMLPMTICDGHAIVVMHGGPVRHFTLRELLAGEP